MALSLPLAGVGARGLAALLDLLAVFLCWIAGLFVYSIWGDLLGRWQGLSWVGQLVVVGAVLAAGWGWDVAWEVGWRGQTPGKRVLGLRVVQLDGAPVGLPASLVRNALRVVELPLGYAPAVLAVALSGRRQRLGDLVAGTLVVQERPFDLGRYGALAAAEARWRELKGRAPGLLAPADFERLDDFLRRRSGFDEVPRAGLAARLASALAARAGVAPPAAGDAESMLEAFHDFAAGRPQGVAAFVRTRREGWERLAALLERVDGGRLGVAEVEELDRLYRRTLGDLAHARGAFPGTDAEGYLAQLAARAFAALHRRRRSGWRSAVALLRREGAAEVVRHGGALALATAFLAGGLLAGALVTALDPEGWSWLIPASVREALAARRLWTDDLLGSAPGLAGGAIARNNLSVAALCFALGLTGGVGTALLLAANGALLGAVLVAAWQAGLGPGLAGFVAAHGPVELSALALAGQAGFVLAGGLVRPGEWPRREALARSGREAARILVLVAPLLLLVAAVEATVSPAGRFPLAARVSLGLALAAAVWSYLWRAGRAAAAEPASARGASR